MDTFTIRTATIATTTVPWRSCSNLAGIAATVGRRERHAERRLEGRREIVAHVRFDVRVARAAVRQTQLRDAQVVVAAVGDDQAERVCPSTYEPPPP